MSENLQRRIDEAVKQLSAQAYEVALRQIGDSREAMDRIVEVLMEKETISGDDFRKMLAGACVCVFVFVCVFVCLCVCLCVFWGVGGGAG